MTADLAAARDELAAAVRRLSDVIVDSSADADTLRVAASDIDRLAALFRAAPPRRELQDTPFHPTSLVGGTAHPVAPQLRLTEVDGGVAGTVTLGRRFEGGPGLAHGGVVALLFDHAMGTAVFVGGNGAMTRALEVTYCAPTPLGCELTVTARVDRIEGRKVFAIAELTAGDTVTATATAVFVQLTQDNVSRIFDDRGRFSAEV